MPILLTIPKSAGMGDPHAPDGEYKEIKLKSVQLDPDYKIVTCNLIYGNTIEGEWVDGVETNNTSVIIRNEAAGTIFNHETQEEEEVPATTDFDGFMGTKPIDLEKTQYENLEGSVYLYLLDKSFFSGTIV